MEQLNQNKKWLAIVELLIAIISAVVLFPIGFFYSILIEPFIRNEPNKVFKYFNKFFYGIWFVFTHTLHSVAFAIDILGNIIVGELIEKLITNQKNTWFGMSNHSISQSIGFLEKYEFLNKRGIWLSNFLNKIFGKKHCINAFENYRLNNK